MVFIAVFVFYGYLTFSYYLRYGTPLARCSWEVRYNVKLLFEWVLFDFFILTIQKRKIYYSNSSFIKVPFIYLKFT